MTSARLLAALLGLAGLAAQARVDATPGRPLSDDELSQVQSAVLEIDGTISIVPVGAKTVRTRHRVRAVRPGGN